MTTHTPGPWRVIDYSSESKGFIAVVGSSDVPEHICDVFPFGHRPGGIKRELEQHAANARLIRAAPELLEALNELYRLRGLGCDLQDEASLRAADAIAKAEGRSE